MKKGYVYILASDRNGTLYIGVTSDIGRREWEHRTKSQSGFTARYGVDRLVYVESFDDIATAIVREKAMKKWRRAWKIELIEKANPEWENLSFNGGM
ncbi:MAG: GIY-YIG nuclease family protein [Bdellovibrionales bacterium]|jgi:putative endonuclease